MMQIYSVISTVTSICPTKDYDKATFKPTETDFTSSTSKLLTDKAIHVRTVDSSTQPKRITFSVWGCLFFTFICNK